MAGFRAWQALTGTTLLLWTALALPQAIYAAPPLCVSDEGIHCFGSAELKPLWQRRQGRTTHAPVVAGTMVVAGGDEGVAAFADDGAALWRLTDYGHAFTPTITDDGLFFGTLGGELISAAADGFVRWRRQFGGWLYSPAVLGDVVASGGQAGVLYGLRRTDGKTLWEITLDQELVNHPVAIDAGSLAATTFAGTVLRLDAQAGRVIWRRAFGVPSQTPVISRELLLCPLFDGRVVAVAVDDGAVVWEIKLPAAVEIVASAGRVLAYDEAHLVVLDRGTGEVVQRRAFYESIVAARWLDPDRLVVFLRGMRNQVRAAAVSF